MDGAAAAGSSALYSRGDHVHPSDTSRYAATNPAGYQTASQVTAALPAGSSTTPIMNGSAAVGTASTWARADHVHPVDTSCYPASNPSGFQTAAQVSASISAAAYVLPTASTTVLGGIKVDGTSITIASGVASATPGAAPSGTAPVMDGTAAVGVSAAYSRGDHVHPSDTSRYAATNPSGYQTAAQVSSAISAAAYTLPTASTSVLGGVMVDGTSITIAAGKISAGGSVPSGTTPVMDGTATAGVATAYSRGDHVHPTDTTRYAASNPNGYQTAAQVSAALPVVTTTTPAMDGTAAIGASGKWADGAHVHPTDTTRAPLAGVTNASNASAGQVGEWLVAQQLTNVPLTTAVAQNLVILSLTAGDWDVDANAYFVFSAANGSSTVASVSTVSGTHPAVGNAGTGRNLMGGTANQSGMSVPTGRVRVNVSATTNVYIVVTAIFASGTCNCQGTIQARRMR
jgi:hypothetical protein